MEFRLTIVLSLVELEFKQCVCCFNFLPLGRPVWEGISLLLLILTFVILFPLARKVKMTDVFPSTGKEKFLLNLSQMLVTSVAFRLDGFSMCCGIIPMLPWFHTNLQAFVLLRFGSL